MEGGLGSAVAEFVAEHRYATRLVRLGIPDRFIEHGTQQQLYAECGYDAASISRALRESVVKNENSDTTYEPENPIA